MPLPFGPPPVRTRGTAAAPNPIGSLTRPEQPGIRYQRLGELGLGTMFEDEIRDEQRQDVLDEHQRQVTDKANADFEKKSSNTEAEARFRAENRPFYTDAFGVIRPSHDDQTWEEEKRKKQETADIKTRKAEATKTVALATAQKAGADPLLGKKARTDAQGELEIQKRAVDAQAREYARKQIEDTDVYKKANTGWFDLSLDKQPEDQAGKDLLERHKLLSDPATPLPDDVRQEYLAKHPEAGAGLTKAQSALQADDEHRAQLQGLKRTIARGRAVAAGASPAELEQTMPRTPEEIGIEVKQNRANLEAIRARTSRGVTGPEIGDLRNQEQEAINRVRQSEAALQSALKARQQTQANAKAAGTAQMQADAVAATGGPARVLPTVEEKDGAFIDPASPGPIARREADNTITATSTGAVEKVAAKAGATPVYLQNPEATAAKEADKKDQAQREAGARQWQALGMGGGMPAPGNSNQPQDTAAATAKELQAKRVEAAAHLDQQITGFGAMREDIVKQVAPKRAEIQARLNRGEIDETTANDAIRTHTDALLSAYESERGSRNATLKTALEDFGKGVVSAQQLNRLFAAAGSEKTGTAVYAENEAEIAKIGRDTKQDAEFAKKNDPTLQWSAREPSVEALTEAGQAASDAAGTKTERFAKHAAARINGMEAQIRVSQAALENTRPGDTVNREWHQRTIDDLTTQIANLKAAPETQAQKAVTTAEKWQAAQAELAKLSGPGSAYDKALTKLAEEKGYTGPEIDAHKQRVRLEAIDTMPANLSEQVTRSGGIAGWVGTKLPFAGGFFKIAQTLLPAAQTVAKLKAGEKPDEAEMAALEETINYLNRPKTTLGSQNIQMFVDIVSNLPAYAIELGSTAGIVSAVRSGTTAALTASLRAMMTVEGRKLAREALAKYSAEYGAAYGKREAADYAGSIVARLARQQASRVVERQLPGRFATGVVGEVVRTPIASLDDITETATLNYTTKGLHLERDAAGKVAATLDKDAPSFAQAMAGGYVNSLIENTTEKFGSAMHFAGLGKALRASPVYQKLVSDSFLRVFQRLNPRLQSGSMARFLQKAGMGNMFEEWSEERVADVGHAIFEGQELKIPSLEQTATELVSFAVPGLGVAAQNYRTNRRTEVVRNAAAGITRATLANLSDPMKAAQAVSSNLGGAQVTKEDIAEATALTGPPNRGYASRGVDTQQADLDQQAAQADQAGDLQRAQALRSVAAEVERAKPEAALEDLTESVAAAQDLREARVRAEQGVAAATDDVSYAQAQQQLAAVHRASALAKIASGNQAAVTSDEQAALTIAPAPAVVEEGAGPIITDAGIKEARAVAPVAARLIRQSEAQRRTELAAAQARAAAAATAPHSTAQTPPGAAAATGQPTGQTTGQWTAKSKSGKDLTLPAAAASSAQDALEQMAANLPAGEAIEPTSIQKPVSGKAVGGNAPATGQQPAGAGPGLRKPVLAAIQAYVPRSQHQKAKAVAARLLPVLHAYGHIFRGIRIAPIEGQHGGFQFKDGVLQVDIARATDNAPDNTTGEWIRAAIEEEVIHYAATEVIKEDEAREFWKNLGDTPEGTDLQNVVIKSYLTALEAEGKALPKPGDVDAWVMTHEFVRMMVQDSAFAKRVTEAMEVDSLKLEPGVADTIREFLRRIVDYLRQAIKRIPEDQRAAAEDMVRRTVEKLREMGVQIEGEAEQQAEKSGKTGKKGVTGVTTPPADSKKTEIKQDLLVQPASSKEMVMGREDTMDVGTEEVRFTWAVTDARNLVTSHDVNGKENPAFDQELQNRLDRKDVTKSRAYQEIKAGPKFSRLSAYRTPADGAPTVEEAKQVMAGNARALGIVAAYATGKAGSYKALLIAAAGNYGFKPADLAGIEYPVLVRVVSGLDADSKRTIVEEGNAKSDVEAMTPQDQAVQDAKNIPLEAAAGIEENPEGQIIPNNNTEFFQQFRSNAVRPSEEKDFDGGKESGKLTQAGLERVRNAVFVLAYSSDAHSLQVLKDLTESLDEDDPAKNISRALTAGAASLARMNARMALGNAAPTDFAQDVIYAARVYAQLKKAGKSVAEALEPELASTETGQEMLPQMTPIQRDILQFFADNNRSAAKIANALHGFAKLAEAQESESLLGDGPSTKEAMWARASGRTAVAETAPKKIIAPGLKPGEVGKAATKVEQEPAPEEEEVDYADLGVDPEDDFDPEEEKRKGIQYGATRNQRIEGIQRSYGMLSPDVRLRNDPKGMPWIMRGRGLLADLAGQTHVVMPQVALPLIPKVPNPKGKRFIPLAGDKSNWVGRINAAINSEAPNLDDNTDIYIEPYGGGLVYLQNIDALRDTKKPVMIAVSSEFEFRRLAIYQALRDNNTAAIKDMKAVLTNPATYTPVTDEGKFIITLIFGSKERTATKATKAALDQMDSLQALLQKPNVTLLPWADEAMLNSAIEQATAGKRVTLFDDSDYADLPHESTKTVYKGGKKNEGFDTTMGLAGIGPSAEEVVQNYIGKDAKKLLARKLPIYRAVIGSGGTIIATNNMAPGLLNGLLAEFGDQGSWLGYNHQSRLVADDQFKHPDGMGVLWRNERPEYLAILRQGPQNPASQPKYGTDTDDGRNYRAGSRRTHEELDREASLGADAAGSPAGDELAAGQAEVGPGPSGDQQAAGSGGSETVPPTGGVDDLQPGLFAGARPITDKQDRDYMAAVKAGDMKKAQAMVVAAAKQANVRWVKGHPDFVLDVPEFGRIRSYTSAPNREGEEADKTWKEVHTFGDLFADAADKTQDSKGKLDKLRQKNKMRIADLAGSAEAVAFRNPSIHFIYGYTLDASDLKHEAENAAARGQDAIISIEDVEAVRGLSYNEGLGEAWDDEHNMTIRHYLYGKEEWEEDGPPAKTDEETAAAMANVLARINWDHATGDRYWSAGSVKVAAWNDLSMKPVELDDEGDPIPLSDRFPDETSPLFAAPRAQGPRPEDKELQKQIRALVAQVDAGELTVPTLAERLEAIRPAQDTRMDSGIWWLLHPALEDYKGNTREGRGPGFHDYTPEQATKANEEALMARARKAAKQRLVHPDVADAQQKAFFDERDRKRGIGLNAAPRIKQLTDKDTGAVIRYELGEDGPTPYVEVTWMETPTENQGKGAGTALLKRLFDKFPKRKLGTVWFEGGSEDFMQKFFARNPEYISRWLWDANPSLAEDVLRDAKERGDKAGAAHIQEQMDEPDALFAAPRFRRSADELTRLAKDSKAFRNWFSDFETWLNDFLDEHKDYAPLISEFLSATSAATKVGHNVTFTMRALRSFILTGNPDVSLQAHQANVGRATRGEQLSGPKISEYSDAVFGRPDAIPVDRHIAQLMFGIEKPLARHIKAAKRRITQIALRLKWEPRQVMAALWAANQKLNDQLATSYDTYLAQHRAEIHALLAQDAAGEGRGREAARRIAARISAARDAARGADGKLAAGQRTVSLTPLTKEQRHSIIDKGIDEADLDKAIAENDPLLPYKVLWYWQTIGFTEIADEVDPRYNAAFDDAVSRLPTVSMPGVTIHRKQGYETKAELDKYIRRYAPGSVINIERPVNAFTTNEEYSDDMAETYGGPFQVRFEIKDPKMGRDLEAVTQPGSKGGEVLYPRGSSFEIESIDRRKDGATVRLLERSAPAPKDAALFAGTRTKSPEFQRWFAGSKAVDHNGDPLLLAHGTFKDVGESFARRGGLAGHFGTIRTAENRMGHRVEDGYEAETMEGARIIPVHLSIKNPLRMTDVHFDDGKEMADDLVERRIMTRAEANVIAPDFKYTDKSVRAVVRFLEAKGYDGIVYRNRIEGAGSDSWIPFRPNQIKSAIANNGKYGKTSNILRAGQRAQIPDFIRLAGPEGRATVGDHEEIAASSDPARARQLVRGQDAGANQQAGQGELPADSRQIPAGRMASGIRALPEIDQAALRAGLAGRDLYEGNEHWAWQVGNDAIKIGKPPAAGDQRGALYEGLDHYLMRLDFANKELEDDITVLGWIQDPDGNYLPVIQQPWAHGRPSTRGEINRHLVTKGFETIFDGLHYRRRDDLFLSDGLEKNAVTTDDGKVHIIDFVLPQLSEKSRDQYLAMHEGQMRDRLPGLRAAARPDQIAKVRAEVLANNTPTDKLAAWKAWLTPDAKWINVRGGDHPDIYPKSLWDMIRTREVPSGYDVMMDAGFVRVAKSNTGGRGMKLYAEYFTITPKQRKELEDTAIEHGAELDTERTGRTLRSAPRIGAAPAFYSQLERVVADKLPSSTTKKQLLDIVRSPQNRVKADEVKWSGIIPWIEAQGDKITKDAVLRYLREEGAVRFREVSTQQIEDPADLDILRKHGWSLERNPEDEGMFAFMEPESGDFVSADEVEAWAKDPSNNVPAEVVGATRRITNALNGSPEISTKYGRYQEPGGTNYREVVLAMTRENTERITGIITAKEGGSALDDILTDMSAEGMEDLEYGRTQLDDGREVIEVENFTRDQWDKVIAMAVKYDAHFMATKVEGTSREGAEKRLTELLDKWSQPNSETWGPEQRAVVGDEIRRLRVQLSTTHGLQKAYTSGHFASVTDYVAHMRLNDRTDDKGEPGTFIEETQSDRHQQGRESGYITARPAYNIKDTGLEVKRLVGQTYGESIWWGVYAKGTDDLVSGSWTDRKEADEEKARMEADPAGYEMPAATTGEIPDAPYRQSRDWSLALFKRALRDAVAAGHKWIGWTGGAIQQDRYDLSKHIDTLEWSRHDMEHISLTATRAGTRIISERKVKIEDLPGEVGKEMAKKIIDASEAQIDRTHRAIALRKEIAEAKAKLAAARAPGVRLASIADMEQAYRSATWPNSPNSNSGTFHGLDLKIGGTGMLEFYDKIFVNAVRDYVKQWGAKPEPAKMATADPRAMPQFVPMGRHEQMTFSGAEDFEDGSPPLMGEALVFVNGEETKLDVIISATGVSFMDKEGANEWAAFKDHFTDSADPWGHPKTALSDVKDQWEDPQSRFWQQLTAIISEPGTVGNIVGQRGSTSLSPFKVPVPKPPTGTIWNSFVGSGNRIMGVTAGGRKVRVSTVGGPSDAAATLAHNLATAYNEAIQHTYTSGTASDIWRVAITPQMAEGVKQGQALFAGSRTGARRNSAYEKALLGDKGDSPIRKIIAEANPYGRHAALDKWLADNPKSRIRLQQLVDQAAAAAGAGPKVWRGDSNPIWQLRPEFRGTSTRATGAHNAFWFTTSRTDAASFAANAGRKSNLEPVTRPFYILGRALNGRDDDHPNDAGFWSMVDKRGYRQSFDYAVFREVTDTVDPQNYRDVAVDGKRVFIDPRGALDELVEAVINGEVTAESAAEDLGQEMIEYGPDPDGPDGAVTQIMRALLDNPKRLSIAPAGVATVYGVWNPQVAKLADPITFEVASGHVYALKHRFNPALNNLLMAGPRAGAQEMARHTRAHAAALAELAAMPAPTITPYGRKKSLAGRGDAIGWIAKAMRAATLDRPAGFNLGAQFHGRITVPPAAGKEIQGMRHLEIVHESDPGVVLLSTPALTAEGVRLALHGLPGTLRANRRALSAQAGAEASKAARIARDAAMSPAARLALIAPELVRQADQEGRTRLLDLARGYNAGETAPFQTMAIDALRPEPAPTTEVDVAANEAATSPINFHAQPSDAQKKAGNYKMGHVEIGPLDLTLENAAGSIRSGKDGAGKPWSVMLKSHYGYAKRTRGKDGDHIDVFVKVGTPTDWNGPVFVINQNRPDGTFDEHKAVIGVKTPEEARAEYLSNYSPGWKGLGSVAGFPSVEAFRQWAGVRQRMAPAKGGSPRAYSPERIYYHGSRELKGTLRPGAGGNAKRFLHEEGIWFAPNAGKDFDSSWVSDATRYSGDAGTIVEAKVALKNPYRGSVDNIVSDKINAKWLRDRGYDGFVDDVTGSGMVVALDPGQVTEVTRWPAAESLLRARAREENTGLAAATRPGVQQGFYSGLARVVFAKMPEQATVDQVRGIIGGQDVKQEEVKWSGLLPWLDQQAGKVSKQDVLDLIEAKGADSFTEQRLVTKQAYDRIEQQEQDALEELQQKYWRLIDEDAPQAKITAAQAAYDARYKTKVQRLLNLHEAHYDRNDLQLPGGDNYRELVLTRQGRAPKERAHWTVKTDIQGMHNAFFMTNARGLDDLRRVTVGYSPTKEEDDGIKAMWEAARQMGVTPLVEEYVRALKDAENRKPEYQTGHFGGMHDYVAHVRLTDREIRKPGMRNPAEIEEQIMKALPWAKTAASLASGSPDVAVTKGLITPEEAGLYAEVRGYTSGSHLGKYADRGTLIEEMQSDRHQQGRERGYKSDLPKGWTITEVKGGPVRYGTTDYLELKDPDGTVKGVSAENNRELLLTTAHAHATGGQAVADAPYRSSWPLQMFKRVLRDAVAEGKGWVGWTNGATQADRYDLSHQVDSIDVIYRADGTYTLGAKKDGQRVGLGDEVMQVPADKLEDYIGKELAKRIIDDRAHTAKFAPKYDIKEIPDPYGGDSKWIVTENGKPFVRGLGNTEPMQWDDEGEADGAADELNSEYWSNYQNHKTYSGLDLKVGGKGMLKFYDEMMPKEIGRYVKQWGAKVERTTLQLPRGNGKVYFTVHGTGITDPNCDIQYGDLIDGDPVAYWVAQGVPAKKAQKALADFNERVEVPIWRIDITPAMATAAKEGQPLYAGARAGTEDPDVRAGLDLLAERLPDEALREAAAASGSWFDHAIDMPEDEKQAVKAKGVVDLVYHQRLISQTHQGWNEQAQEAVREDRDAVMRELVDDVLSEGLLTNPIKAKAAQILIPQMFRRAIASGDAQAMRDAQALAWGYDIAGTETARALASRWQPHKTPEEQNRELLAKIIFAPPPAERAKIEELPTPAQKDAKVAAINAELERAKAAAEAAAGRSASEARAAKAEVAALTAQLAAARGQKDRFERLAEVNAKRLERIEEELENLGITLHDLFTSREVVVRLRGSALVRRALEPFSEQERRAIKLMFDGTSDRQIAKQLGMKRAEVEKLQARTEAAMLAVFQKWTQRGFSLSDMEALDTAGNRINLDDILNDNGTLKASARSTVPGGDPITAAKEMIRAIMPTAKARNTGALKRLTGDSAAVPYGFDAANPAHAVTVARVIQSIDNTPMDKLYEYWINGILSGPATHVANITGNLANFTLEYTLQRGLEATANLFMRDAALASFGEFGQMAKASRQAFGDAFAAMRQAWKTEADLFEHSWLNAPVTIAHAPDKAGSAHYAIQGTKGRIIRIPCRGLMAMDAFFKHLIGRLEATAQAYRLARAEGRTGDDLQRRIRGQLNTPGSAAWTLAVREAKELTFQTDLPKWLKNLEKMKNEKAESPGGAIGRLFLRFLFPFIRTPWNIFATGLRKTPLGSIGVASRVGTALYHIKDGKPFFDSYSKALMAKHLVEQALGWTAFALLNALAEGDPDDDKKKILITGTRSQSDRAGEKRLLERTRGGETSIVINGKPVFNYGRIEPFATIIATMVDTLRMIKRHEHGAPMADVAAAALGNIKDQVESKTFFQGIEAIHDMFEQVRNPDRVGKSMAQALVKNLVPNIIRQPMRNMDAYARDTKNAPLIYSAFPMGGLAAPLYDLYGRPVEKTGTPASRLFLQAGTAVPPVQSADVALEKWNLTHPQKGETYYPGPDILHRYKGPDGKWVEMTPEELTAQRREGGRNLAGKLAATVSPAEASAPTAETTQKIKKARDSAFQETRDNMFLRGQRPPPEPKRALSLAEMMGWGKVR